MAQKERHGVGQWLVLAGAIIFVFTIIVWRHFRLTHEDRAFAIGALCVAGVLIMTGGVLYGRLRLGLLRQRMAQEPPAPGSPDIREAKINLVAAIFSYVACLFLVFGSGALAAVSARVIEIRFLGWATLFVGLLAYLTFVTYFRRTLTELGVRPGFSWLGFLVPCVPILSLFLAWHIDWALSYHVAVASERYIMFLYIEFAVCSAGLLFPLLGFLGVNRLMKARQTTPPK